MTDDRPFVGRQLELARLQERLNDALEGQGSVAVVIGEPGIGKTRLVQELENYAATRGAQISWGRSAEASGATAYWPWIEVGEAPTSDLDLLASDNPVLVQRARQLSELERLFPSIRQLPGFIEPQGTVDSESARFRMFNAFTRLLHERSDEHPWLIVIDDLQWADEAALRLLEHLARGVATSHALIVATCREQDAQASSALSDTLVSLAREPSFTRMRLSGLSSAEVDEYVRLTLDETASPELVARVMDATEGNPFFLLEVVSLLKGSTRANGFAHAVILPDGVRDALRQRLAALSDDARVLMRYAAVAGRVFSYETLKIVRDLDGQTLLRLLEEGFSARIIEETQRRGEYRFIHALMRETLLDEVSGTRRVHIHGELADALEQQWGAQADTHASLLAVHFNESASLNGRHGEAALHYSTLAARQAEAQFAWREASRLYSSCVDILHSRDPRPEGDEAALLTAWGRCAFNDGDGATAWRVLMQAIDHARARADGTAEAQAAFEAVRTFAPDARRITVAREALLALGDADPRLEAALLAWVVLLGSGSADLASADELKRAAQRATTLAEGAMPLVQAQLANTAAREAAVEGRLDAAAAGYRRAHEIATASGNLNGGAINGYFLAVTEFQRGSIEAGRRAAFTALGEVQGYGLRVVERSLHALLAASHLARAEYAELERLGGDPSNRATYVPFLLCAVHEIRNERTDSAELLGIAPMGGNALATVPHFAARARALWMAEEVEAARTDFEAACNATQGLRVWHSRTNRRVIPELIAPLDEALVGLGDESFLRAVHEFGHFIFDDAPERLYYDGLSGRSVLRVLASVALGLDEAEDALAWYTEALAWCEREGCPIEAGRCELGLAEIARRRADTSEVLRNLDTAATRFREHGAVRYLAQAEAALWDMGRRPRRGASAASTYPDHLTGREVEVLCLVAAGKSNSEIADELVLSVRTVERHITNSYRKIGARGRADATSYILSRDVQRPTPA